MAEKSTKHRHPMQEPDSMVPPRPMTLNNIVFLGRKKVGIPRILRGVGQPNTSADYTPSLDTYHYRESRSARDYVLVDAGGVNEEEAQRQMEVAKGLVVVYDPSDTESKSYVESITKLAAGKPGLLVAPKVDEDWRVLATSQEWDIGREEEVDTKLGYLANRLAHRSRYSSPFDSYVVAV
ncbi:Uu.00g130090.m01.CDS01 [Anthostomella pinea]|uniref:Uu.00g130090.m01.CDS01 n=1 Tax=Anthostomella pinea TaxID=933095 RepID=A0AAI8VIM4_9PEZI|nr:Uu.00g130090.m01.CDS01 [Anthostomella pinea]